MTQKKKKCFVITPIGNDDSNIRRHIDGIIDQSIIPALGEKYEIDVAHRKYEIGSINDRIINSTYKADLVIANLTTLNPNVMFELAVRYSFGKPAIVIAEKETKLPFDIVDENTIFYVNDPTGADDLKNKIIEFESNIDYDKQGYGPVHKAVSRIPLYNAIETGEQVSNDSMLKYIIERLDTIEKNVNIKTQIQGKHNGIRFFETQSFEDKNAELNRKINVLSEGRKLGNYGMRVHELAKELNVSNREIMEILNATGCYPKSHMSTLTVEELDILIEYYRKKL